MRERIDFYTPTLFQLGITYPCQSSKSTQKPLPQIQPMTKYNKPKWGCMRMNVDLLCMDVWFYNDISQLTNLLPESIPKGDIISCTNFISLYFAFIQHCPIKSNKWFESNDIIMH